MKFAVGQPVPRKEDPRLITGQGEFTGDVSLPGQLFAAFHRSQVAHGTITSLDVSAAREAPGVQAVYTADDLTDLGPMPCRAVLKDADGKPCFIPRRPVLAEKTVKFVGQAIVAVIADTRQQARNAAELVEVEIDDLPVSVDLQASAEPDAPVLHPEHGSNLSVHWQNGDSDAVDAALASADHVVRLKVINNRVAPSPLEPRCTLAEYRDGRYTLYNPSQGAVAQKGVLATSIFNVPMDQVRVISLDTGGGFGIRGEVHPEPCVCLFAAKALGRPVKWTGDRSEMFLTDSHGRDNVSHATMGFDSQGHITALRVETLANLGAYCTAVGPFVPTMGGGKVIGTVYRIPAVHHSVKCVFTNTMPVAAYRGAGRPEACYLTERLMEKAALQMNVDALELRRMNFVTAAEMPYTNGFGEDISSGEFAQTMDMALEQADWTGFADRRASTPAKRRRGIGLGMYMEASGGGIEEEASVRIRSSGQVDVTVGTYSHGQGHRTAFSQVISEALGVDFEDVNIIQGDTDKVAFGGGTGGSRSSQMGGVAVLKSAQAVVEQGRPIAAEMLQTEGQALEFTDGEYRQTQSGDQRVTLLAVAREAETRGTPLDKLVRYSRGGGFTFPNGCHIAEVEIDCETGELEVCEYTAVDDCGRVINPLLAGGQVHGGVGQGLGQALLENIVYDENGQLLTGSFMDYTMPRASHLPDVNVSFNEVPDPNNDLGVKGIGEGGACGSPPAVVNAVLNALAGDGVTDVDMPLTSEKIWRLINR
jgi:carbon-monoxide dehydrogenase large subunit